ncbi:DUF551 domain-containing protein [Escherichia coli]|nr:DUF551 domain-containing protein [Escherichia coli]HBP4363899.1 DUF551 domain-containing protein [Escherichia coli]
MTTITKERLLTIKEWRETYGPGSNVVLPAEEAEELARIALASLEAKPVAYIFKHPAGKLFWALTDESNKEQADVIPVYAAAPASVVPDNASESLAYAYKELTPEIMRGHIAVFERYGIVPNDSIITIQALRIALDGIERSDAMLHAGNFRENANSSTNNFRETSETSTNSPVTPDGWVMVPKKLTAENGAKGVLSGEFSETTFISCPECFGDDDCDTCDGSGRIEIKVPVTWTTIKSIWDKGIAHFAAKPPQEVNRG